jgi:hypothetical protein
MNVRFGAWNVINLYRAGSHKTVARKFANRNLSFPFVCCRAVLEICNLFKPIFWPRLIETEGMQLLFMLDQWYTTRLRAE